MKIQGSRAGSLTAFQPQRCSHSSCGMEGLGSCAGCGGRGKAGWPCSTLRVLNRCLAAGDAGLALEMRHESRLSKASFPKVLVAHEQSRAALHCVVLQQGCLEGHWVTWHPPVSAHSSHQPNASAAPQASNTLPPAAGAKAERSCSPCGRSTTGAQHGSGVCVPKPPAPCPSLPLTGLAPAAGKVPRGRWQL